MTERDLGKISHVNPITLADLPLRDELVGELAENGTRGVLVAKDGEFVGNERMVNVQYAHEASLLR